LGELPEQAGDAVELAFRAFLVAAQEVVDADFAQARLGAGVQHFGGQIESLAEFQCPLLA